MPVFVCSLNRPRVGPQHRPMSLLFLPTQVAAAVCEGHGDAAIQLRLKCIIEGFPIHLGFTSSEYLTRERERRSVAQGPVGLSQKSVTNLIFQGDLKSPKGLACIVCSCWMSTPPTKTSPRKSRPTPGTIDEDTGPAPVPGLNTQETGQFTRSLVSSSKNPHQSCKAGPTSGMIPNTCAGPFRQESQSTSKVLDSAPCRQEEIHQKNPATI